MITLLRHIRRWSQQARCLLLMGIGGVLFYNWFLWRRDKAQLAATQPSSYPSLESWPELPQVSVLVAAWNEAEHIDRLIRSFLSLRYPNKELILCAGGPDNTYPLACRYGAASVIVLEQQPGEGKQRALARCLPQATGTIVFLTDADCELADNSFERTLLPVAFRTDVACTGGFQPYAEQAAHPLVYAQIAGQLYVSLRTPPYTSGIAGCNFAVQRQILTSTRALEAPAVTGTDYVLAKTLSSNGVRIRQQPQSRIATAYPTTIAGYIRQKRRWLRNVAVHGFRFGAMNEVRASLQTSLVGLAMLVLPLLIPFGGPLLGVLWVMVFVYGLASRFRYLLVAHNVLKIKVTPNSIISLPLIMYLDFVAWTITLFDYVSPRSRARW